MLRRGSLCGGCTATHEIRCDVGVLSVILGWALLFRAAVMVLYLVVVGVCFHGFVVLYEERHLRREFGSEYDGPALSTRRPGMSTPVVWGAGYRDWSAAGQEEPIRVTSGLSSILPSALVLGIAGITALFLTVSRGWAAESRMHIPGAVRIAVVAVFFQAAHFTEELLTGLSERLPALFGLAPMSLWFFASFNVAWLVIWSLSSWGLAAKRRAALFPLWFLGIGCTVNGVAHPALAVFAGGYFPGLVTSPVVGVLGVLLLRRLLVVTHAVDASPSAA